MGMTRKDIKKKKPLYLNIIWHQHQPLYLDPGTDQLQGPWVRTHGTKDYYDMVRILQDYPDIHVTVNLTSSLLYQLQEYYVNRLKPFIDLKNNRIDFRKFLSKQGGKTDPWIDLALTPTEDFTERDIQYLLTDTWNAFGISPVMLERFPRYKDLKERFDRGGVEAMTTQDMREVKFWFFAAHFDPDFLNGPIKLVTGTTVDLSDLIHRNPEGTYRLKRGVSEEDCRRMVVEAYKILAAIIPLHKKMLFNSSTGKGQIEVITTPYFHPILPLIYDSDLAKLCQPSDEMPDRYHFPHDAEMQVKKAVSFYQKMFGTKPTGMWPAEGSVAHDIVPVFGNQGIKWIATDEKILQRSKPGNQEKFYPYVVHGNGVLRDSVVVVFRDTELSDKIGFLYQDWNGEDAAEDFMQSLRKFIPEGDDPDRLLTVILDGENAWEWYRFDHDGKTFQNALYRKLTNLFKNNEVVTTTVTEYLRGHKKRGIRPHPVGKLPRLEWLWPGSWINANFDTWIGEEEENKAWNYLLTARNDLEASGIKPPPVGRQAPRKGTKQWFAEKAWDALYAAEGSDWFWWYGTDQTAPSGDKPFDIGFITHLNNVYAFARQAGGTMPEREFSPIITNDKNLERAARGTMAQSRSDLVKVAFQCQAGEMYVRKSLYIVGSHPELGSWTPNKVKMYDDGTHGDTAAGDNIWGVEVYLPPGVDIEYKYTNSGAVGEWNPGEEFPQTNRRIAVVNEPGGKMTITDRFGHL